MILLTVFCFCFFLDISKCAPVNLSDVKYPVILGECILKLFELGIIVLFLVKFIQLKQL